MKPPMIGGLEIPRQCCWSGLRIVRDTNVERQSTEVDVIFESRMLSSCGVGAESMDDQDQGGLSCEGLVQWKVGHGSSAKSAAKRG